jgi:hypothetical protein
MAQMQLHTENMELARQGRSRIVLAMRRLEDGLAAASTTRERRWIGRVYDALAELQAALRETRQTADAKGNLLAELVDENPRLCGRAERLRAEYDKLQHFVEEMSRSINGDEVETVRQRLGNLLTRLRAVQAQETELIFEAYHVDIGVGD